MEERPTKRPRQKQEGCRDDHLYLDDGNIVLSALDTDDGVVYFRVHRSVLSRQSPVFKDMFNIPTGDSVEKYDGVPLVRLHDGADDVKDFLRALYDPECVQRSIPRFYLLTNTAVSYPSHDSATRPRLSCLAL